MKPIFSSLLLLTVIGTSVSHRDFGQGQGASPVWHDQARESSPRVQLTMKIVSQQYCKQVVGQQHETQLRLKLKLVLRNVSSEPLIIHRYSASIFRVVLSKSLRKAEAKTYAYDANYSLMRSLSGERDFSDSSPKNEFIVLKPNEFHQYEYDQQTEISLTDLGNPKWRLPSRDYFLQINIETWSWALAKAEELQQRWAKYGYFWYSDAKSEPLPLRIEQPTSMTTKCE